MVYKAFCDEATSMMRELKILCKDMTRKEFEDYKNEVTQKIGGNKSAFQFMEMVFDFINPAREVAT